ncbi:MAG: tellurium resistance protein [Gemmobacter sp.]
MSRPPAMRPAIPPVLPRAAPPPGLWRGTPPAIFPPILGLFALGLGWRRAGAILESRFATGLGEAVLGAVTLLFLFALIAYGAKLLRRPAVAAEDLRVLPGRGGLAAAAVGIYALAAAIAPYGPGAAHGLIVAGLALHGLLLVLVVRVMLAGPPEGRVVTPIWHLMFVGFLVAALAAAQSGWAGLARGIFWAMVPLAAAIWAVSLWQIATRIPPAPLRPLLAIHVAPASLLATIAAEAGIGIGPLFLALAAAVALALAVSVRWVTVAGFSPLWGSFTFPIGAFAGALVAQGWAVAGGLMLVAATLAIPAIAFRVMRMWADRSLGARTNAAVA